MFCTFFANCDICFAVFALFLFVLFVFYNGIVHAVFLPQHGFLVGPADCSESSVKSDKYQKEL